MTALRTLRTTAGRGVGLAQDLYLLAVPHGGQRAARANALRAMSLDSERARERRRAQAAVIAAARRHPVVASRRRPPVELVRAHA